MHARILNNNIAKLRADFEMYNRGFPSFFQRSKDKIAGMSCNHGGEKNKKSLDGWHHLHTMLYAVVFRLNSLHEIEVSMLTEVRIVGYIGLFSIS